MAVKAELFAKIFAETVQLDDAQAQEKPVH
jgi:hypothetical protein